MNRGEIRVMARKSLGDTTGAFWTDAELNTYINLGCKDLAWRTKCLRTVGYLPTFSVASGTVSNVTNEYVISTYFPTALAINEVYFKLDGKRFQRLEPTSREALDTEYEGWQSMIGYTTTDTSGASAVTTYNVESQPGIPQQYYWNRNEDVFGIYPPCGDEQEGADYLKVYYSYNHTDMGSDTDTPSIPEELHPAIVNFVVVRGFEDRGWGDRANDFWQKYFSQIKDYKIESMRAREDDVLISKSYRNL